MTVMLGDPFTARIVTNQASEGFPSHDSYNQVLQVMTPFGLTSEPRKNLLTFHYTGCFIGVLTLVCYDPYITG